MQIKNEFEFGQTVYLKTDEEQKERIITGFVIRPNGLLYYVACGTGETPHYAVELTTEKDIIKATSN